MGLSWLRASMYIKLNLALPVFSGEKNDHEER